MLNVKICSLPLDKVETLYKKLTEKEMLVLFVISGTNDIKEAARILKYDRYQNLQKTIDSLIEKNVLVKVGNTYDFVATKGKLFTPQVKPRKKTLQDKETYVSLLPRILKYVDQKNEYVWSSTMKHLIDTYDSTVDDAANCVEYLYNLHKVRVSSANLRREYSNWLKSGKPSHDELSEEDLISGI